jgi:BTB/POZ domain
MSSSDGATNLIRSVIRETEDPNDALLICPSHAGSDSVKVLVGEQRKTYMFHKTLLTSRCPYFAKCLAPSFPEGRLNEVVLEEESCEAFDHFFDWIYTEQVDRKKMVPFGALYMLADRFCMEAFKNSIADTLMEYCASRLVPLKELTPLVNHGLSRSRLVEVLMVHTAIDIVLWDNDPDDEHLTSLGNLFRDTKVLGRFIDILERAFRSHGEGELTSAADINRCYFHDHKETAKCANKGRMVLGDWRHEEEC